MFHHSVAIVGIVFCRTSFSQPGPCRYVRSRSPYFSIAAAVSVNVQKNIRISASPPPVSIQHALLKANSARCSLMVKYMFSGDPSEFLQRFYHAFQQVHGNFTSGYCGLGPFSSSPLPVPFRYLSKKSSTYALTRRAPRSPLIGPVIPVRSSISVKSCRSVKL